MVTPHQKSGNSEKANAKLHTWGGAAPAVSGDGWPGSISLEKELGKLRATSTSVIVALCINEGWLT